MTLNLYQNPSTPFVGPIHGGLRNDLQIHVSGTPDGPDNRFSINLKSGKENDDDIALHFNPRFNDNQVVRNTRKSGSWGQEERNGPFPFQKNKRFDMVILVLPNLYRVSVNGQHYCDYNHRLPALQVSYIHADGGLKLDFIRIDLPPVYLVEDQLAPIYNPCVPFNKKFGCLYPGKMIFIGGIPNPGANRFSIDFCTGGDVAFHFDARFVLGSDRNVLVRNTRTSGTWGKEERDAPYFPFVSDKYFDMIVLVDPICFKVAVNNKHLLTYNHRCQALHMIDTINIGGDIRLCQVRFQ